MVMNHDDSAFNRHPNPARGCTESVNWNLKGARVALKISYATDWVADFRGIRPLVGELGFSLIGYPMRFA